MNNVTFDWDKAISSNSATSANVGDLFVSASGVGMLVENITVNGLHRSSSPQILITYRWDDNGSQGVETVGYGNFIDNLRS